jgi:hypothetical protein
LVASWLIIGGSRVDGVPGDAVVVLPDDEAEVHIVSVEDSVLPKPMLVKTISIENNIIVRSIVVVADHHVPSGVPGLIELVGD